MSEPKGNRVEWVPAADLQPGTVIDNVTRIVVVEACEKTPATVRVTYRYTDDRSLIQRDSARMSPQSRVRVRTEADRDLVDGILNATVGLPR